MQVGKVASWTNCWVWHWIKLPRIIVSNGTFSILWLMLYPLIPDSCREEFGFSFHSWISRFWATEVHIVVAISGTVCRIDSMVQDLQRHLSSCPLKTSTFFHSKEDHAHELIMSWTDALGIGIWKTKSRIRNMYCVLGRYKFLTIRDHAANGLDQAAQPSCHWMFTMVWTWSPLACHG
jgi:hypothetical protein